MSNSKGRYAPGQHGQSRKKLTEYGVQLREKQKVQILWNSGIPNAKIFFYGG